MAITVGKTLIGSGFLKFMVITGFMIWVLYKWAEKNDWWRG